MYNDVPGYGSIIFRKQRTDLELTDGLIDIAKKRWHWGEKGAKWDGRNYRWTFPSGATHSFGYMGPPRADGHLRYKSAWYQFIGFDQVEEIPRNQYIYMNSRLGRLLKYNWVPLRLWSSANPDGLEWVYERFVKKETLDPTTLYIPATADDNPWVDLEALEERLLKLDPITYRQLRQAVWGLASAGGMFEPTNFVHVKLLPIGRPLVGIRYWDLAATDEMEGGEPAYSCGVRMFRDTRTNLTYTDNVQHGRWSPVKVEDMLRSTAMLDRKFSIDAKIPMIVTWIEQEPGSSGKSIIDHYMRDPLAGYAAFGERVTGSKEDRAKPWAGHVARKLAHLVIGEEEGSALWIEPFKNEHRRFPGGEFKDRVDASSGAFNKLFDVAREPKFA